MKLRLLIAAAVLLLTQPAFASMVWSAVAVEPSQAAKLRADSALVERTLDSPQKGRSAYLDKAWHGIHFLLTGSDGPTSQLASQVIFGGEPVGPDQGYGPAQLLPPSTVKQIAKLLQSQTPEVLSARYDPKAMESAKIYPDMIWVREGPEALKYLLQFYSQLVAFYSGAAERGDAVLLVIH